MNLLNSIETQTNHLPIKKATLYGDGGSRGNPGPAALGYVLYTETNQIIHEEGVYLGHATNNFAEYQSLVYGLAKALELEVTNIQVFMDSNLAVEQINGNWKVKHPEIKILWEKAMALKEQFQVFSIQHVPREQNKKADSLVNQVLDQS